MCRRTSTLAWCTIAMLTAMLRDLATARPTRRPPSCRVVGEMRHEPLVQDGEPRALEHTPGGRHRQRRQFVLALPGAQQVALAEQLGAEAALEATRLTSSPSSTSSPIPPRPLDMGALRQRPVGSEITLATHSAVARSRTSGGIDSARPGSTSSTLHRSASAVVGVWLISIVSTARPADCGPKHTCHVPYPKRRPSTVLPDRRRVEGRKGPIRRFRAAAGRRSGP